MFLSSIMKHACHKIPVNNPFVIPGIPLIEYTLELFQNVGDITDLMYVDSLASLFEQLS